MPDGSALRVNAVILDGGLVPNVIPDYAKVKMEFRTSSMRRLEDVDDIIRKCARGAAIALDCEVKLDFPYPDYADVVRNTRSCSQSLDSRWSR